MDDRSEGWSRQEFVGGLTLAGTAGLLGLQPEYATAEPPPETTRLRVHKDIRLKPWLASPVLRRC